MPTNNKNAVDKKMRHFHIFEVKQSIEQNQPHNQATILLAYPGSSFQVQILGPKF